MASTFSRNRFTWLAYLLLAFYSYYLNCLGPITPYLKSELGLSYWVSSLHFSAFAVGMLIAGLGGHLLIGRAGRRKALWTGAVGLSLSALLLVAGRSPLVTISACLLMGAIGSLILVLVPDALSTQHGEARAVALGEANVISSLFGTASPLLVGWFAQLAAGGWRLALVAMAFAPLLFRLVFARTAPAEIKPVQPDSTAAAQRLSLLYWLYWFAILLAVSVEFCMLSWSADYLETALGMVKASAVQAVSLFLAAMIVGRLAGSSLVQRFKSQQLVVASTVLAAVGFAIYWSAPSPLPGMIGLFITGLGVASLYPFILSLAIGAANGNTVAGSARASLASGSAILLLPLVLGRLADGVGIRQAYGVVALLLAGTLAIILFTGRLARPRQPALD